MRVRTKATSSASDGVSVPAWQIRDEFMADGSSDLVQGTLDMRILKTLALEPMHGYGVAVRIEQISRAFSASMQVPCLSLSDAGNELD